MEEDVKLLSKEDKERIGELKDMMVPIIGVASAIFFTVMAFVIPIMALIVLVETI